MPIEPHRKKTGPNWNEGARLLWLAMLEGDLRQSDVTRRLVGPSGEPLSDGALNRWLYGERRPSWPLRLQMETLFGVAPEVWDQPAPSGRMPSRKVAKPEAA